MVSHDPCLGNRLPHEFYSQATEEVARSLIGKALLHRSGNVWVGGWIVETEAYLHRGDPASHSVRGKTASNASMFSCPGTLYVYPIHARFCMNAVTQAEGEGAAVLIRAIEPIWGIETMCCNRKLDDHGRLTRGPAMLCQALAIDRTDDGRSLVTDQELGIFSIGKSVNRKVRSAKRIGISKARHRNLRFIDPNSSFLSRPVSSNRSRSG